MAFGVILKGNAPPRGAGTQLPVTYNDVMSVDLTWSWGARPASGVIVYASDQLLQENASIVIEAPVTNDPVTGAPVAPGGVVKFYGLAKQQVATDSSAGQTNTLNFVDMREVLSWDQVIGFFNKRQDLLQDGIWVKRYAHLLPENQAVNLITYTPGPYSAAQILDFIFTAPTVLSPWVRLYHDTQRAFPVYNIDCSTGRTLADVVTEISQKMGLVFTLIGGQWQLVWVRKGFGFVPSNFAQFPANSDHRRLGAAISGQPASVTIFGGRNRYQVLDIPMEADWVEAIIAPLSIVGADYVNFEASFTDYVYRNMADPITGRDYASATGGDPENITGYMLAKARAETITMGELADFIDEFFEGEGEAFRDRRKFNGRTRLDLPVFIYVKLLVYRAFKLPSNFQITTADGGTVGPLSCHIIATTLVETIYDYVSGDMSYIAETAPGGNGLAIVQGFNFLSPPPLVFRSDQFDLNAWLNTQKLWQRANFQIDDTGDQTQFIILDEPVAVSQNLMTTIDGHGALNADATFFTPQVRASLVLEAERFQSAYGELGGVNAIQDVSDLNADYVVEFLQTTEPDEQTFADGQTATEKAAAIADYILLQQPVYVMGGYLNRGCNGTQLSGTIDRVNTRISAEDGLTEAVDFTTERAGNAFEPERDFERRIQLLQLAPGQADLRNDARYNRQLADTLRHNPRFITQLVKAFHDRYGSGSELFNTTILDGDDSGPLQMGTPLWRPAAVNEGGYMTNGQAVLPADSDPDSSPVFAGATIRHLEPVNSTAYVALQRTGIGLARVLGPANVGDTLVQVAGADYLASVCAVGSDSDGPVAGSLQQAVPDSAVHLVQVLFQVRGNTECF